MAEEQVNVVTGEVVEPKQALVPLSQNNIAAVAAAEQSRALVEARVLMAIKRPRDIDRVRLALLGDCKRPRFAETARYAKPMGGKPVVGWSIRFAEAAVRTMGNIDVRTQIISETDDAVILRVDAIDLQTNSGFGGEVTIRKTVERTRLRDGELAISVRTNSSGRPTYLVRANEDDMVTKLGSYISKAIRTYALRLVPADILDECLEQVEKTAAGNEKQDPAAVRKRIVDSYAEIGVGPDDVKRLVGKTDLTLLTEADLKKLRETFVALRDGEVTLDEVLTLEKSEKAGPEAATTLADRVKAGAAKGGAGAAKD
jgi:hypothetical protein